MVAVDKFASASCWCWGREGMITNLLIVFRQRTMGVGMRRNELEDGFEVRKRLRSAKRVEAVTSPTHTATADRLGSDSFHDRSTQSVDHFLSKLSMNYKMSLGLVGIPGRAQCLRKHIMRTQILWPFFDERLRDLDRSCSVSHGKVHFRQQQSRRKIDRLKPRQTCSRSTSACL